MKAMQSLFVSSAQVLNSMKLVDDCSFYESPKVRAYLKTRKGVYFQELNDETREQKFLRMLMKNVLAAISKHI